MPDSKKTYTRMAGVLFISSCLTLVGCEEPQQEAEIVRPVRAMKVQDVAGYRARFFPGRAASTQEINASFRVAGQLIQRPIDIGAEIKQGELIASLDPSTYQAEVDRLKAEVANSKATRERAELELDRQTKLFEEGWVTKSRLDTVNATTSAARASVLASEAALQRAELDLSYTTLTAPFDGLVVETYVENFQEVLAKQPIARVVNTEQVEFWVSIPENLISMAPYTREITVEFDAFPGQPLPAKIKEIKNEASQTTRSFDVNLIMNQPDDFTVLPGMAGKASAGRIELPQEQQVKGYEVPLVAVHNPQGDKDYLWLIDESSMTVSRREIETIEPTGRGIRVKGVKPGDWIVIAGVEYLREGQKVRFQQ